MSTTATDSYLFVEEVVTALTGVVQEGMSAETAVKSQMQRAAEEFDQRTAEAFARALLDHLCQDPDDLRRREALIIMGLAHPSVLDKHRISLETEGERLILLLERAGQKARARCMREMIARGMASATRVSTPAVDQGAPRKAEEMIELYLQRADDACSRGKNAEAITWLQEVVALDRNRRDVARMIRDLRFAENERRAKGKRRAKTSLVFVMIVGAVVAAAFRERRIEGAFESIPQAKSGDARSIRTRADEIDVLIRREYAWLGLMPAMTERDRLAREASELEDADAQKARAAELEVEKEHEMAELARLRGMQYAKEGKFEAALADLKSALELSPASWEHRARVQADVAAIESWKAKTP